MNTKLSNDQITSVEYMVVLDRYVLIYTSFNDVEMIERDNPRYAEIEQMVATWDMRKSNNRNGDLVAYIYTPKSTDNEPALPITERHEVPLSLILNDLGYHDRQPARTPNHFFDFSDELEYEYDQQFYELELEDSGGLIRTDDYRATIGLPPIEPDFAEYDSYRDTVDRTCEYCDITRAVQTCGSCGGCVNCCQCSQLATFQMDVVSWRQAVYAASYVQNQGYTLDSDRMVLWKRVNDFGTAYICDHDGLHFVILYDVQDCHSLAIEALVKHRDGLEDGIAYELVQRARVANGSAYPASATRNINPQGQFSAFRSSARG